jgi:hypothetical protein
MTQWLVVLGAALILFGSTGTVFAQGCDPCPDKGKVMPAPAGPTKP